MEFVLYRCVNPVRSYDLMLSLMTNLTGTQSADNWRKAYIEVRQKGTLVVLVLVLHLYW